METNKLGLISDAHGNAECLQKCIEYLQPRCDRILFLGDSVGYLPEAAEVIDLLMSARVTALLGNHDAMLLGRLALEPEHDQQYRLVQARQQLSSKHYEWLQALLPYAELKFGGKKLLCVHGSPWEPLTGYIYPDADLSSFAHLRHDAIFMGHTHRPFSRRSGNVLVANVGSCGLPRDQGGLACCALYDPTNNTCQILRFAWEVERLIQRYQSHLHPRVIECLRRTPAQPPEGRVLCDNL